MNAAATENLGSDEQPHLQNSSWSKYKPSNLAPSFFSRRSYLLSPWWRRNRKEDQLWEHNINRRLPNYSTLCRSEYIELSVRGKMWFHEQDWLVDRPILKLVMWNLYHFGCILLVLSHLGHLFTDIGRRTYSVILWKYYKFLFFVCPGIWSQRMKFYLAI